jgi:hypothetical protein
MMRYSRVLHRKPRGGAGAAQPWLLGTWTHSGKASIKVVAVTIILAVVVVVRLGRFLHERGGGGGGG